MRRLVVGLSFAVAACGTPAEEPPLDASCPIPPAEQQCAATCGNGRVDECFVLPTNRCEEWQARTEACDGAAGMTCESFGFYGGMPTCDVNCTQFDERTCVACAPGVHCDTFADHTPYLGFAASGTRLLMIGAPVTVVENGTVIRTASQTVVNAVGVPGGWLVSSGSPATLTSVDIDGNTTGAIALGSNTSPEMVFGPANRVFMVWPDNAPPIRHLAFALTDTAGNVIMSGGHLVEGSFTWPSVTTDGANFFAAADRTVARVTPDGVVSINNSFAPVDDSTVSWPRITCHGTSCWYFAHGSDARNCVAQRFDATGAPTGAAIQFDLVYGADEVIADGDDLLIFAFEGTTAPQRLRMRRLTPDGTMSAPTEIGVGATNIVALRHGDDVLVSWLTPITGRLATLTPSSASFSPARPSR